MTTAEKLLKLAERYEWQPIETLTYPRHKKDMNEREVWYSEVSDIVIVKTSRGAIGMCPVTRGFEHAYSHWMPLPDGKAGEIIRILVECISQLRAHSNRWQSAEEVDAFMDDALTRAAKIDTNHACL